MALTKVSQSMIQGSIISVMDFGAKNDGTDATGTTAAIQAAIDYAQANSEVRCIEFPGGNYSVNSTIEIYGNFNYGLLINGNNSVITASHNGIVFDCNSAIPSPAPAFRQNLTINNFIIVGPGKAQTSSVGINLYGANYYINNVTIDAFYGGIKGYGCLISEFFCCNVQQCHFGLWFGFYGDFAPNDNHFYKCNITSNERAIRYTDFDYGAITFTGCEIEGNNLSGDASDGVAVCEFNGSPNGAGEVTFVGSHFELNPGEYNIFYNSPNDRHLNIIGCKVIPGDTSGSCIYVNYGQLFVTGSHIAQNVGTNIFLSVDCSNATVIGNTAGLITGTLTKLVRIIDGGFQVGNSRYYTQNGSIWINRLAGCGIEPTTDNTDSLGTGGLRWSTVYAGTGTINTSDERDKQNFKDMSEAEREAAIGIKGLLKSFKFKDAVAKKGDKARIHFGVSAQQVAEVFKIVGLNPDDYAMFCYDEWKEVCDEDGNILSEGGNRYGIRYDELLAFIIGAL